MMTTVMPKNKVLWWYLRRPHYYREFARLCKIELKKLCSSRSNDTVEPARQWCKIMALPLSEALLKIGVLTTPLQFEEKYKKQLQQAQEREQQCSVTMGGGSDLALLFLLSEHIAARRVIETGVAYGWSSLAFLLSLQNRDDSVLWSTDKPYPGLGNEQFVGCVVPPEYQSLWTIFREADRTGLPKALGLAGQIDLCHYDSDKSYDGRRWAYPLLWKALRPGGIFLSDDIGDNFAFRDFCEKINIEPIVVQSEERFIGVLIKKYS